MVRWCPYHMIHIITQRWLAVQKGSRMYCQGSVATLTDAEDESGVSEDSVFFDLFTSSWGENDNHWDEGFDPTLTNSRTHMEEHDTREQKHVKKGVATVVPLGGDVVQNGAAGNNKRGQLKGPMGVEVLPAVKEVDDEENVLQAVPRETHSQSVSEILQRVRSGLARMGAAVKVSSPTSARVYYVVTLLDFYTSPFPFYSYCWLPFCGFVPWLFGGDRTLIVEVQFQSHFQAQGLMLVEFPPWWHWAFTLCNRGYVYTLHQSDGSV